MSTETQQPPSEQPQEQQKAQNDKEINFARVRKQLEEERSARQAAEQRVAEYEKHLQERSASKQTQEDDDVGDDEPYVDHKRLEKKLARFEKNLEQKIDKKAEEKAHRIFEEHKKQDWLRNNPDFYEVMGNAQIIADKDPELAETILQMPDNFERQKLVYRNIKMLNGQQKEQQKSTIQDKVDQVRRGVFYQPTGVGTAPYAAAGDFSPSGQKSSYDKMQELKNRLRI